MMWFCNKREKTVKCQDCGFLAIRDPDNSEFIAPSVHYRSEGFQGSPKHLWPHPQPMPNCFVREHPIHNEPLMAGGRVVGKMSGEAPGDFRIGDGKGGDGTEEGILSIIAKPRICKSFSPWLGGLSPKEHYETREARLRRISDRKWRVVELAVSFIAGALTANLAIVINRLLSSGNGNPPMP